MIKLSNYLIKKLEEAGITQAFMISGGGAMHLNEAIGQSKKISYICNHHEQACAMAQEGYSRYAQNLAVTIVTSGPGGTNTITGVAGQWLDSVPAIYISGQVKFETTTRSSPELNLRQLGDQELDIVKLVSNITKYAVMVTDPNQIRKEIEKALFLAKNGRPGPVWLDIPLNIQSAMIDESQLIGWEYPKEKDDYKIPIQEVIELLKNAKRPVIIAGQGIRLSHALNEFHQLLNIIKIPVVTTFCGFDQIHSNHPLFAGRIGTLGTRSGNFALQNADLVLSLGSRNNIRQLSYNWECVAKNAKKILVDIDRAELDKKTFIPDLKVHSDIKDFINEFLKLNISFADYQEWINWCVERREKYPSVLTEYMELKDRVHPYYFMKFLTSTAHEKHPIVSANGTACVALFQAGEPRKDQRIFWNSGCATMGYALPASIGLACASKKNVICIEGDGSIMMNLQELQTIRHNNLNIKVFILNNQGYQSIKQTQKNFFNEHYVACTTKSGVTTPDFKKIASAFEIEYHQIANHKQMHKNLEFILNQNGPLICEVFLDLDYVFSPKVASKKLEDGSMVSSPLEDMYPFLSTEELSLNKI